MAFGTFITLVVAISAAGLGYGADISRAPRIIGGLYAQENAYPYQVSLHKADEYHCGAAIVSKNYLVTAAHCVVSSICPWNPFDVSILSVRVGSIYLGTGGSVLGVSDITVHPRFNFPTLFSDIALVRLSSPLTFSESVAAITLATSPPPLGAEVTIVGWGRPVIQEPKSFFLKHSKMETVKCECESESVLCLKGDGFTGTCAGDSGSAGIYNGTLVGVVSAGDELCAISTPAYFTMVSEFDNWLKENSDL